jgi:hypothetical protein
LAATVLVAIATMMALVTEIMTALVIGIGIDSGIGVTADTIGPADFGLLTDVRTVGPFKTASANHTGAIEQAAS